MTLKKLILAIAGGIAILGTFLPWVRVSMSFFGVSTSESANAFNVGGALYVILAILAIICGAALILLNVLKEKQIKNFVKFKGLDKIPLYIGIALAIIAVVAFIAISSQKGDTHGLGTVTVSWGVWLIGIAGIITIVLPLLKNVKELDKVIIGKPEKAEKSEKPAKKETAKKK